MEGWGINAPIQVYLYRVNLPIYFNLLKKTYRRCCLFIGGGKGAVV